MTDDLIDLGKQRDERIDHETPVWARNLEEKRRQSRPETGPSSIRRKAPRRFARTLSQLQLFVMSRK